MVFHLLLPLSRPIPLPTHTPLLILTPPLILLPLFHPSLTILLHHTLLNLSSILQPQPLHPSPRIHPPMLTPLPPSLLLITLTPLPMLTPLPPPRLLLITLTPLPSPPSLLQMHILPIPSSLLPPPPSPPLIQIIKILLNPLQCAAINKHKRENIIVE